MAEQKKAEADSAPGTKKMWLSKPRFLQQPGESLPSRVDASPEAPVQVTVPAKVQRRVKTKDGKGFEVVEVDHPEDSHLTFRKPGTPRDVRPNVRVSVPAAAEQSKPAEGVRATDK
jgi:hypothetical protein